MSTSNNSNTETTTSPPPPIPKTLWGKLSTAGWQPSYETFSELPEIITVVRVVLGILFGISLGMRGTFGGIQLLYGLNIVSFLPIVYLNSYLAVQTDTYSTITFAGIATGMAVMVMVWILLFTMAHSDEESILASAAVAGAQAMMKAQQQQEAADAAVDTQEFPDETSAAGAGAAMDDASAPPSSAMNDQTEF